MAFYLKNSTVFFLTCKKFLLIFICIFILKGYLETAMICGKVPKVRHVMVSI